MFLRPLLQHVFANECELGSGIEQESIVVSADSDLDSRVSAGCNIRAQQSLSPVRNTTGFSNRQHLLWIIEDNLIVLQCCGGKQPLHGCSIGDSGCAEMDKGLATS